MNNTAEPVQTQTKLRTRVGAAGETRGQKYMVMTTKHHEGFCHFDYEDDELLRRRNRQPGRDLVQEYVDAARAEGLRFGFYYSLMDWHHPDGARCAKDEAARRRFVDYIHTQVRELMTNYGKIDILWYDVLLAAGCEGLGVGKDEHDGVRSCSRTSSSTTATSCRAIFRLPNNVSKQPKSAAPGKPA